MAESMAVIHTYITNQSGSKVYLEALKAKKNKGLGSQILAFLLNGMEAAFIHHLTTLSTEYGFTVVGNEHDGLVTTDEIPPTAITKASILSGLKDPTLVIKPFY